MCICVSVWEALKALMASFHCGHQVPSDNVAVVSSVFQLRLQTHVSHRHTVDGGARHVKGRFNDLDGNLSSAHCVPCMHFTSAAKASILKELWL